MYIDSDPYDGSNTTPDSAVCVIWQARPASGYTPSEGQDRKWNVGKVPNQRGFTRENSCRELLKNISYNLTHKQNYNNTNRLSAFLHAVSYIFQHIF